MNTISNNTHRFIKAAYQAIRTLNHNILLDRDLYYFQHELFDNDDYINLILKLESHAERLVSNQELSLEFNDNVDIGDIYPTFYETISATPIYSDVILLEKQSILVPPKKIMNLQYLLKIPNTKNGVDIENHNFGYHFHYGKVKPNKNTINRTNLLFTFNPINKPDNMPLYYEYHASGKNIDICVETIGENKRHPIYLTCKEKGQEIGFENFKIPAAKSDVFYNPNNQ
ncbi:hypothetical protein HB860_05315 [Aeromonas sp. 3925]|uniref:hypothetical protein n=1 Tax=Aeromonas TaxID=642 RepID=UPI001FFDE840|nr:hypothetical protein [Aeromonas genomosp. paramedia]MCK2083363.1 hypothetical protein [Aeromonas genomosp. paramedia]